MMNNLNSRTLLLIAVIVVPIFCLALAVAATFVGFGLSSAVTASNVLAPSLDEAEIEAEILDIAAEFAGTEDLAAAQARLSALGLPNISQYVSFMVDRYIQENRGLNDADTRHLFLLADAIGASTVSMTAALATPTSRPTPTLPPTATPLPTDTPPPPPKPEPTEAPSEEPVPTDALVPTDTPVPPSPTPGPPTYTPEPTATPEPTRPATDFVVAEAYLLPNPVYDSCPGWNQIFVSVIDATGNPIDGVTVEDTFRAVPAHVSGEKGAGKLEYDLWNNGFSLEVTAKTDGSPASSEVTPKLSSWDEDIPDDWLVQANYCKDLADCQRRKSSNQLCRGHYAYNVTFKRTY